MSSQIKVGIYVVIGLIILLAIFDFVSDIPVFSKNVTYYAYYDSISQLREGSLVKLEGVEIGKVTNIEIEDRKIKVTMYVKKGDSIKKDSVAGIRLTGLLGTNYVNISFGSSDSAIAQNGSVLNGKDPADLNVILSDVQSAVGSIDSALSAFSALGENKDKINNLINSFDSVLSDVAQGKGTIGKLFKDDSVYNEANSALIEAKHALGNVNEITLSIKEGKGTLGKLYIDDSLYTETKDAFSNIAQFTSKLTKAEGTFGKLLNDDTLYNEATEAATNLNSVLKKINDGQGTIGKLVNDDSLYIDAKDTLKKVDRSIDTVEDLAPLGIISTAFGIVTFF